MASLELRSRANENVFQDRNARLLERLLVSHNISHQRIGGLESGSIGSVDLENATGVDDAEFVAMI